MNLIQVYSSITENTKIEKKIPGSICYIGIWVFTTSDSERSDRY